MTSRERVIAAMQHKDPDRVPVWCQLGEEHVLKYSSGNKDDYFSDSKKCVQAWLEMWRMYGFDGILVTLPGRPPKGEKGTFSLIINHSVPDDINEFDIKTWGSVTTSPPEWFGDTYRLVKKEVGNEVFVGGWLPDPFAAMYNNLTASWNRERALMAFIDYPEKVHQMLDYYCHQQIAVAKAEIETGVDSLHISNAWGGASLISTVHFREFILPYVKRFISAIKTPDVFTYYHICGFIGDRLELMAESGTDGIECMDPPPLGDVELKDAKKRVGDKIFLKGNIDAVNTLLRGSEKEIVDKVKECISIGAPGGGYILSTACSIPPGVPPEKIKLMVKTAREFGNY